MAFYEDRELDRVRNEVRMLTIVEPPEGSDHDKARLVHCRLEHVSLDDLTPEFARFLKDDNRSKKPLDTLTDSWLRGSVSDRRPDFTDSMENLFQLPIWRWMLEHGIVDHYLDEWDEVMEAIDTDFTQCPQIPQIPRIVNLRSVLQPAELRMSRKYQEVSFRPRFLWGDFEAISYCWESDVRGREIYIDDTLFKCQRILKHCSKGCVHSQTQSLG
ncbi:hypothetical protein DL98DRAFT_621347, partial [Cadophora sp. DSE1049]